MGIRADGLVGLLAIIAPFALGFSTLIAALRSMIILGGLAVILSGYEWSEIYRFFLYRKETMTS